MKSIFFAAVLATLVTGCASTEPLANKPANNQAGPSETAKPPKLIVGTSYPDEPLILPWFLDDAIGSVNAH